MKNRHKTGPAKVGSPGLSIEELKIGVFRPFPRGRGFLNAAMRSGSDIAKYLSMSAMVMLFLDVQ